MIEAVSYKLIKKLPNSNTEVGTVESYFGGTNSTPTWRGTIYYNSNSEYWQKVDLDKEYEIINYIITDGVFKESMTDNINNCGLLGHEFKVSSVKRLSDNEIFTIGEEVEIYNSFGGTFKINGFHLSKGDDLVVDHNDGNTFLYNIKKKIEYPIIKSFIDTKIPANIYFEKNGLYGFGNEFCLSLESFLHDMRCVDSGDFYIDEVIISETETLKIGDKVEYIGNPSVKNSVPFFIIDNFYYRCDGMIVCRSKGNLNVEDVMTVKIVVEEKRKLIFVTEDDVDIFEDDVTYWISRSSGEWKYLYDLKINELHKSILFKNSNFKIFSSKYLAELFILKENMLSSFKTWNEDVSKYENKLKEGK